MLFGSLQEYIDKISHLGTSWSSLVSNSPIFLVCRIHKIPWLVPFYNLNSPESLSWSLNGCLWELIEMIHWYYALQELMVLFGLLRLICMSYNPLILNICIHFSSFKKFEMIWFYQILVLRAFYVSCRSDKKGGYVPHPRFVKERFRPVPLCSPVLLPTPHALVNNFPFEASWSSYQN